MSLGAYTWNNSAVDNKREAEIITREPEPVADPQGFIIGTPCFGSTATGCSLKQDKRNEDDFTIRQDGPTDEPQPEIEMRDPEPQGFIIGAPCFGSTATGCTLKEDKREAEPVAEPQPKIETRDPQGFVIGTPCFGSTATGCTLKEDKH